MSDLLGTKFGKGTRSIYRIQSPRGVALRITPLKFGMK